MNSAMENGRRPRLLDETVDLGELDGYSADDLEFRLITENDALFNRSYQLMKDQFSVDVLDPIERYIGWLQMNKVGNPFPYLMLAAVLGVGDNDFVVGTISGNIMKIGEYAGENPEYERAPYVFAIGHQVTSPILREIGFKGVGTRLWEAGSLEAKKWIESLGGAYICSFLEAEDASVVFWDKMGYRWPKGVQYWQPPLDFDEAGNYLYPEVPEVLLVNMIGGERCDAIPAVLLKNIVATAYQHWALDKFRNSLSPPAFEKARAYVMDNIFGRFCRNLPAGEFINLVSYTDKDGRAN